MDNEQNPQQMLQNMVAGIKREMKPKSKNDLIRIISALALDNFTLKVQLQQLQQESKPSESTEAKND